MREAKEETGKAVSADGSGQDSAVSKEIGLLDLGIREKGGQINEKSS